MNKILHNNNKTSNLDINLALSLTFSLAEFNSGIIH